MPRPMPIRPLWLKNWALVPEVPRCYAAQLTVHSRDQLVDGFLPACRELLQELSDVGLVRVGHAQRSLARGARNVGAVSEAINDGTRPRAVGPGGARTCCPVRVSRAYRFSISIANSG